MKKTGPSKRWEDAGAQAHSGTACAASVILRPRRVFCLQAIELPRKEEPAKNLRAFRAPALCGPLRSLPSPPRPFRRFISEVRKKKQKQSYERPNAGAERGENAARAPLLDARLSPAHNGRACTSLGATGRSGFTSPSAASSRAVLLFPSSPPPPLQIGYFSHHCQHPLL